MPWRSRDAQGIDRLGIPGRTEQYHSSRAASLRVFRSGAGSRRRTTRRAGKLTAGEPFRSLFRLMGMDHVDVWQAYRAAFDEFSQKVRQVQLLAAHPGVEQQAIDQALLELETAHVLYNVTRAALAEQYHPARGQDTPH